ncbi:hypothetical protein [Desulfosarcina sp.]|uniref:hypothetical protein n=1 Tax=Desulfosarcina sp. TaxID=2027861 RepID=UPI0035644552
MGIMFNLVLHAVSFYLILAPVLNPAFAQDSTQTLAEARFGEAVLAGRIESDRLVECSGMDASLIADDLLWAVNDSGNGPFICALGLDGSDRGSVRVAGAKNRDWEDMDTFVWQGRPMILIADVGDNNRRREQYTLYVVEEPGPGSDLVRHSGTVDLAWRIDFSYPDGKYDAEGVAVDAAAGEVLIVTKRDKPPLLFAVPLSATGAGSAVTARRVGAIERIPPPSNQDRRHVFGAYYSQPTALDISPDGRKMVVLTYQHAYLFSRMFRESWASAVKERPAMIRLPSPHDGRLLRQREAICFSPDGMSLLVTSEGDRPGIFELKAR